MTTDKKNMYHGCVKLGNEYTPERRARNTEAKLKYLVFPVIERNWRGMEHLAYDRLLCEIRARKEKELL